MKKLLLLLVIVGAFVVYTSTLNETTKSQYKDTYDSILARWFDVGEDDPEPGIDKTRALGPYRTTRIVGGDADLFEIKNADNGYDLLGDFIPIGIDGDTWYSWQAGAEYTTDRFKMFGEGIAEGSLKYTVSVLDVKGDAELLDIVEFKVVTAHYMHTTYEEYPIDEFLGTVAAGADSLLAYQIMACMPDEIPEGYENLSISAISLEVTITEAE